MTRLLQDATVAAQPRALGHQRVVDDPAMRAVIEQAAAAAYEDGVAAGRCAAADERGQIRDAIVAAVEQAEARVRAVVEDDVQGSIGLALDIAEFVVGREPHDGGTAVCERINGALEQLDDGDLVVLVHPDDAAAVGEGVRGMRIEGDASLRRGEARVRGRWADADLTRDAAWEAVREALGVRDA